MSELHEVIIEWVGDARIAPLILAASKRSNCEVHSFEEGDGIRLTVKIQHTSLQSLRDIVDALLVDFAEIEESP